MDDLPLQLFSVFMGFFAIMNPIANAPIFFGLTAQDDAQSTAKVAARAVIGAFVITAVFAVAGKLIFSLFGLTYPAFRIAGGALVFMIGLHMLQGQISRVHHPHSADDLDDDSSQDVALFPLAMPILAGPGTLATAMNFSARGGIGSMLVVIVTFGLLCALTYLVFVFGERMVRFLGRSVLSVITRLMGLILAVLGVQMMIEGLLAAFPGWGG